MKLRHNDWFDGNKAGNVQLSRNLFTGPMPGDLSATMSIFLTFRDPDKIADGGT